VSREEIRAWLDTLPEDAEIGIDEGGLCLQMRGSRRWAGCPKRTDRQKNAPLVFLPVGVLK
jgi:hypothetical protein